MSARGRPSAYTPDVALRVRKLLREGWSMTSICAALGVDRSTLFRWQQRDPDLCNGAEVTHAAEAPDPAPNPPDSEASDDQVVLVVRRKPPAPVPVIPPPQPPAPRIDPNSRSVPSHYLADPADREIYAYCGIDGVIAGGMRW
jgi:hypothetical protein